MAGLYPASKYDVKNKKWTKKRKTQEQSLKRADDEKKIITKAISLKPIGNLNSKKVASLKLTKLTNLEYQWGFKGCEMKRNALSKC